MPSFLSLTPGLVSFLEGLTSQREDPASFTSARSESAAVLQLMAEVFSVALIIFRTFKYHLSDQPKYVLGDDAVLNLSDIPDGCANKDIYLRKVYAKHNSPRVYLTELLLAQGSLHILAGREGIVRTSYDSRTPDPASR